VNDLYETGKALVEMGAVLAFDMTTESVLAKLSYLMGKQYSNEKIKMMMMQNLRGEMTDLKKLPNMNTFSLKNN
jgi:L-asparaginase